MGQLEEKLKENRDRRRRDQLLLATGNGLKSIIEKAQFSSDPSVIAFAAFSTWGENDEWTTTRGNVDGWKKHDYSSWGDLAAALKQFSLPRGLPGWLFFDTDGPYYQVNSEEFIGQVDNIFEYITGHGRNDVGWVASHVDAGVIVEFEHTSFCKNDFSICIWGLNVHGRGPR